MSLRKKFINCFPCVTFRLLSTGGFPSIHFELLSIETDSLDTALFAVWLDYYSWGWDFLFIRGFQALFHMNRRKATNCKD